MQAALELLLPASEPTRRALSRSGSRRGSCSAPSSAARDLADRLCAGAPLAVGAVKETAYRGQTLPWTEGVRMGEALRQLVHRSEDTAEGRPPWWQGR